MPVCTASAAEPRALAADCWRLSRFLPDQVVGKQRLVRLLFLRHFGLRLLLLRLLILGASIAVSLLVLLASLRGLLQRFCTCKLLIGRQPRLLLRRPRHCELLFPVLLFLLELGFRLLQAVLPIADLRRGRVLLLPGTRLFRLQSVHRALLRPDDIRQDKKRQSWVTPK